MANEYPFEKLGLLYLGRECDLRQGEGRRDGENDSGDATSPWPFLYKSRDLTTHGVIIGMTGSGKTGLGIGLIEEAVMDDIPSLIIDPKGDMSNLLLSFPHCSAEDFLPWVDPAEAARQEMDVEGYAASMAEKWKAGLESWGQGVERIAALRNKTEFTLYTPGSSAGISLSVLGSLDPPGPEVLSDMDTFNEYVSSTVTSILGLVDIAADPMQSREHIFLSSLLTHCWQEGQKLNLESLIGGVVSPPFSKVGVFSLDTFYPEKERMALAMKLNNILASPSFSSWVQGVPLDIQNLLYTEEGRPCTAIFSIAHLNDKERMFFVTMLLNRFLAWMRRQSGSSSLRTLLYMDEIFGYFPPIANPPSKKTMLLLLKQARAFGVGVVLATQNPVDLDYKGLANIGSWFIGRLQTKQDQERVLAGLGMAGEKAVARDIGSMLASLKERQFLLRSTHLDTVVLFESRWVMSYLKGPLSLADIRRLMADRKQTVENHLYESGSLNNSVAFQGSPEPVDSRDKVCRGGALPPLSPSLEQRFLVHSVNCDAPLFEPWLLGEAKVRFVRSKQNLDEVHSVQYRCFLDEEFRQPVWADAEEFSADLASSSVSPPQQATFSSLPVSIAALHDFRSLQKHFADYLYQNHKLELYRLQGTSFESEPFENLRDFKVRCSVWLKTQKEAALAKLQGKYRNEEDRLEKQRDTALYRLDKEKMDVRSKTTDSLISFGVAVLGSLVGRKVLSSANIGRAARSVKGIGRVAKEKSDVERAEDKVATIEDALHDLLRDVEEKSAEVAARFSLDNHTIETFAVRPRRSDIYDVQVTLLWEVVD